LLFFLPSLKAILRKVENFAFESSVLKMRGRIVSMFPFYRRETRTSRDLACE
jgi:hypothetical protein